MNQHKMKSYLAIPFVLGLFSAKGFAFADEVVEPVVTDSNTEVETVAEVATVAQETVVATTDSEVSNSQETDSENEPATSEEVGFEEKASVQVENYTEYGQTVDVSAKGVDASNPVKSLKVAAWSEEDQANLAWYTADAEDNQASIKIDITNHGNLTGNYKVHSYTSFADDSVQTNDLGVLTLYNRKDSAATAGEEVEQLVSTSYDRKGIRIQYNGTNPEKNPLLYAVWTDANGQDDLKWYLANNLGAAYVQFSNHKEYGKYHVHTYEVVNGKLSGLDGTSIDIERPTFTTTVNKVADSSYDVTITGVDQTITHVLVPVWSQNNGVDDIKWYQATQQEDGAYKVNINTANHANDLGDYNVYVYGNSTVTGGLIGFDRATFTREVNENQYSIETSVTDKGIYVHLDSSGKINHSNVYYAIWSSQDGQDDLKWYRANSSGNALAAFTNHSGYGTYNVHAYYNQNGRLVGVDATSLEIAKPNVTTTIEKVSNTSYRVTVKDVPAYMSSVLLPTWTMANEQDDLKWYTATKVADGTFQYTISTSDHNNETGQYLVHVYGYSQLEDGKLIALGTTDGFVVVSEDVKVSTRNHSIEKGTIEVVISETDTSKKIKSVNVAAWSQSNQENLYWYPSSNVQNGQVVVKVDEKNHNYVKGNYIIHSYVYYTDGSYKVFSMGPYSFQASRPATVARNVSYGGKTFTVYGDYSPSTSALQTLVSAIRNVENQGYTEGFKLMDVSTGYGIEYNANKKYYSASTIKGPYIAALTAVNPASISASSWTMKNVLATSSNEGYTSLRATYGSGPIGTWATQAGISPSVVTGGNYANLTTKELFALWQQNYNYFNSSSQGRTVGTWFQNPNLSPIHSVLGSQYTTQSKAGWIGYPGYHSASDSGIVYTPKGNYIVTIMSDADGKLGLLNPTVSALNNIYNEIKA